MNSTIQGRDIRIALALILSFCFLFTSPLCGQQQPNQQPQQPQQPIVTGNGNGPIDQISSGFYNYGFLESVYYQFTGDSNYKDGLLPSTLIIGGEYPVENALMDFSIAMPNFTWDRISPLEWDLPAGWSYGFEIHNYYATSETTYAGTGNFSAPDVKMDMHLWSFFLKLFLLDPINGLYQPYVGVSYGIINGSFQSITLAGKEHETSFYGAQSSRLMGIQLQADANWGGSFELRTTTAFAETSNDPFDQAKGDTLELDFSGSMVSMCAYVRF